MGFSMHVSFKNKKTLSKIKNVKKCKKNVTRIKNVKNVFYIYGISK